MYVSYDIKSIQQFIFSIPKLKCITGASSQIANFDEEVVKNCGETINASLIFSGGGKGAFAVDSPETAMSLIDTLIQAAHKLGLDIRIGQEAHLPDALQQATKLYPYNPPSLEGEPCSLSGLWPVPNDSAGKQTIHPLIKERLAQAKTDILGTRILASICEDKDLNQLLEGFEVTFMSNVSLSPDSSKQENVEARAAQFSLGNRNRWAIIAMDGNDIGRQLRSCQETKMRDNWDDQRFQDWLIGMSVSLKKCTQGAFIQAITKATKKWVESINKDNDDSLVQCSYQDHNNKPVLVLPFRPLILGGDDVILLCHCDLAFDFVADLAKEFNELSKKHSQTQNKAKDPLWVATNDELTISGGILYCNTGYPLYSAIQYAESLLSSAKNDNRPQADGPVSPAAVDWDTVTDALLDTPAARRQRELRFLDCEINTTIELTSRPYRLSHDPNKSIDTLKSHRAELAKLPETILAKILPSLRQPWSERMKFFASISKRHGNLKDLLWEEPGKLGSAWQETTCADSSNGDKSNSSYTLRTTGLPDALLLLNEEQRFKKTSL